MRTTSTIGILSFLTAATIVKADSWGPAWSLGPTHGSAAIIEATTHFTPGAVPNPSYDGLFLWPGTSNGTSGLIQAGCDSLASNTYCGAAKGQWCCGASYFGIINGQLSQYSGSYVPVNPCDTLTINYKLQSDQKTWVQTVTLAGKVVSTLKSYDGPLLQGGFGTGTECQTNCKGSVATQFYTDTTIILSSADSKFSSTLGIGAGIVSTPLYTPDSGKTWKIDSIKIPPMKIDSNGNSVSHPETSTCNPQATGTATTTKPATTTTSSAPTATGVVPKYGQCGGTGYTGPTTCAAGSTCTYSNEYYSQCL